MSKVDIDMGPIVGSKNKMLHLAFPTTENLKFAEIEVTFTIVEEGAMKDVESQLIKPEEIAAQNLENGRTTLSNTAISAHAIGPCACEHASECILKKRCEDQAA